MMHVVVSLIAVVFYLAAAIPQGLVLMGRGTLNPNLGSPGITNARTVPHRTRLFLFGIIAVSAHGISALGTIYTPEGIDLGIFRVLSLISWFICAIALLNTLRRPLENSLAILFPLACIAIAVSLVGHGPDVYLQNYGAGLLSHILLSILAYSVLALCALQALVLSLQERELKHHHMRGVLRVLPPLQTMESMLFEGLWIGLILLTLAIATGALYVDNLFAQHLVHKTAFSIIAWMIFAALLWGHHQQGWRGHTAVRWTLVGFGALVLAYFGTKFVLELVLHRLPG
ncbi:MAG: cytochrome c biogenesis protein CcsA [Spongiibacteraceae bacterium]